jgi:hypothetical protein
VLDLAPLVQHCAPARVEERVVLERDRGGLDGVDRGAARRQHVPSGRGGGAEPVVVRRLVADRPAGAAVDD